MTRLLSIQNGWFSTARRVESPYANRRPAVIEEAENQANISLLVIHNISLPPNQFGSDDVERLFTGTIDPDKHPFFNTIKHLQVSAHLFIRRNGELVQFVSMEERAWHAGVSSFQGQAGCNDYSIGIELEGTDEVAFTNRQYEQLGAVTKSIQSHYPCISLGRIVGHNDIAPGRKTDPGKHFDWSKYRMLLTEDN